MTRTGVETVHVEPLPSCPEVPDPQQYAAPFVVAPQSAPLAEKLVHSRPAPTWVGTLPPERLQYALAAVVNPHVPAVVDRKL